MKIIILGAGQVGSTVAYHLAREEANEVTIVDIDAVHLRELQDRLDLRTVQGRASHPAVLRAAGAGDADMIIALTDSDETNMVACQVAYTLFHTPTKIARVRAAEYMVEQQKLFAQEAMPVDYIISPEKLVTRHIKRLIQYPGALQVLEFADGKVRLVAVRTHKEGLLVGHQLSELKEHIPNVETRVVAIYRGDRSILPDGKTVIQEDDEIFFIAARKDIRVVMSELRKLEHPVRSVVIAGGGNIGLNLARELERTNQVKLIERDRDRAREISEQLDRTIVLHGDAADEELLTEENIDVCDVFCSVTNADEANILSAMLAKRLGARKVMALINRPSYAALVEAGTIDIAISPQQITLGSLLAHVRRGDVAKVHSLRRGGAEAIEAIAHGKKGHSRVVGRAVEDIALPAGTSISALVRGDEVVIAHHDTVIEEDDHVILFMSDRRKIEEVEKLFQVDVTFI
ncbi:MAG: Trk system potassium transporter TrkA [Gammaproteobacteria bacterium]|nr:Trk system potassium transporter TrkA [Gammaproteobacteria bacterium]NNF62258.1 Trk system potassium transporter TrkA [Gammaproteobacteria bacterium]NNM21055.1 Trk system potassium transporter TrkA [Gammaproteobacteria bacterium]